MSRVNTYLNFPGNAEEAFNFYRPVFATDFIPPVVHFRDLPAGNSMPALSEEEENMILHMELPIFNGHVLMATDMLESLGQQLRIGNNTTISLELDSREEADRFFAALAEGGGDVMAMRDMPWGAYWGVCLDRYGVRWMFSYTAPS
jgi:PhnB protein